MRSFNMLSVISRAIIIVGLIIYSLASLSVPAYAASTEDIPPAPLFCVAIHTVGQRIEAKATAAATAKHTLLSSQDLTSRQASLNTVIAQKRTEWDAEREQQYQAMLGKATNDTQRQAVETFKATAEGAVAARRSLVDSAINIYFKTTSVDLQNEDNQLTLTRQAFVANITSSVTSAESDCNAGVSATQIRQNFQSNLSNATKQLQPTKQSLTDLQSALANARKVEVSSIDVAIKDFNSTMVQARQTLFEQLKAAGASADQLGSN
jgi:hypothetical protein